MHLSREQLLSLLPRLRKVHFIGITSPFCSFSARFLQQKGITVTASEANQESDAAKRWIAEKVLYVGGHSAEYITDDIDLVIFPNGIIPGNPEVQETENKKRPYVLVQELLGAISTQFKTIAIAGTHGKTTTTSLITWLLHKIIGTPNFIVGDAKDTIAEINTNWEIHPESPYLVLEACEYKKQFLSRAPEPFISVITHIDLDHTDYYPTQESYNAAFTEFLHPTQSHIVIDAQRKNESAALQKYKGKATILDIASLRQTVGKIESPLLFGHHNQENLLRAYAVGTVLGLTDADIRNALATFPGVSARFEYKGITKKGTLVYKDFAHNPQKVEACLQGAKEAFPEKKLVVIYQPHNYERTATFKDALVESLKLADVIIFPNIYSVRESDADKQLISNQEFADAIQKRFPEKTFFSTNDTPPYEKTRELAMKQSDDQTLLLLVSAGDIDKIIPELLT